MALTPNCPPPLSFSPPNKIINQPINLFHLPYFLTRGAREHIKVATWSQHFHSTGFLVFFFFILRSNG
jgi:hypothetical protein